MPQMVSFRRTNVDLDNATKYPKAHAVAVAVHDPHESGPDRQSTTPSANHTKCSTGSSAVHPLTGS
jgi:hypothetical protein